MINAIEITDLKKRYGKIESLKGVNLEVPKGTIYGLIGPNGAGKTTLIKALVGIVKPTSGTMNVLGFNPSKDKWKLRKNIGYMPQESSLFETLSPRENITFFGKAQQLHGLKEKVEEIIEFTELKERADDPVHTFSGGMKKRVSLACSLIHEPKVLFLDEPTAAVDPHLKARSWELFKKLAEKGSTLFVSTHLMDEAMLCDKVTILRNGKVILVDSPKEILKKGNTNLLINSTNGQVKSKISSEPEAIAEKLHEYGLSKDIKSLALESDNLEDIVLSIIMGKN